MKCVSKGQERDGGSHGETQQLSCKCVCVVVEMLLLKFCLFFSLVYIFITVLQGSVHPGLPIRETAQRAGGRAKDGLRGAEEPRMVPWSNTKTGNTHTCAYTHKSES